MRKHVDLVGVLYTVWGGVTWLLSASLLSTGLAAAAIGAATGQGKTDSPLAAGIVAAAFFVGSAAGFLYGGVHLLIGRRVRARVERARAAAIVLAVVNLFLPPLGTALGVYALWTLLHDGTKPLFEHAPAGADGQSG